MEAEGTEVAFDQDQLVHALYTSTRGARGGGSRMRTEHLRAVVEERRIIPLYHVVKAVANGEYLRPSVLTFVVEV